MTLAEASHLTGVRNWAYTGATSHSPETTSLSKNQDRASAGATACTSNITFTSPGVSFDPLTGRNNDVIPLGVVKKLEARVSGTHQFWDVAGEENWHYSRRG